MISISSEEKNLKRFLKRKVEINLNTVVKFLICGIACFTITACGGGGGGGSSAVQVRNSKYTTTMYTGKENGGKIVTSEDNIKVTDKNPLGIVAVNTIVTSNGDITINSNSSTNSNKDINSEILKELLQEGVNGAGIYAENGSATNNPGKTITLVGDKLAGIAGFNSNVVNKGIIKGENLKDSSGIFTIEGDVESTGTVILGGDSVTGIEVFRNDENPDDVLVVKNSGKLELSGNNVSGIEAEGNKISIVNSGNINIKNTVKKSEDSDDMDGLGIGVEGDYASITNKGTINFKNTIPAGIKDVTLVALGVAGDNGKITNDGIINVSAKGNKFVDDDDAERYFENGIVGIGVAGRNTVAENNKEINVDGEAVVGMFATDQGQVVNKGIINVNNESFGMVAEGQGSVALNEGTINIKATGNEALVAVNHGIAINRGTINISGKHANIENFEEIPFLRDGTGRVINQGKISIDGVVKMDDSSSIAVAPNSTLSAKEITVNGSVTVLADDAKAGYAEEYSAENVIKGDKVEVGENANIKSNSLMYTAVPVVTNKTLGARLVRTGVADKLDSRFTDVGKALDRAYADAGKLDKSQKAVADKIFDHSGNRADLNSAVAKASGKEYVAVARQVFDIKDSFRKYDSTVINSLGDNDFNATVIGDYSKVDTKDSIANYKDTMTGFNAVAKLPHNMYGVAGYGFSNIDYKDSSSKEKIHTLHAALYKDFVKENNKLTLGVFGDYNFHRMNRESLDSNVKTNFHSYLVGVSGEFAKHYGDKFYVEPMVGLDLTYGNINRVSEDSVLEVSKHDYTSVLPKVGVTFGERFDMADLYVKAQYSKDLGNMDKDLKVKLLNQDATIENENLKAGQFDVSVGVKSEINSVTLSADVGRRFGKTHTTYVKAGIGYRF